MCRFMVYKGTNSILMSDLLTDPSRSIVTQSHASKERIDKNPLNGDGFGVGWYPSNHCSECEKSIETNTKNGHKERVSPCVFTSVTPAWNNLNLTRLAKTVTSPLIFAHVRAAMPGMMVGEANCHPFQHGRFLWMHNGCIADFKKIYRKARESLRDDLYNYIQGTTDSEMSFALFLNQLEDTDAEYSPEHLRLKVTATLKRIYQLSREANIQNPSTLNFAVTDGSTVIVTKYVDLEDCECASLYFSSGNRFVCNTKTEYRMLKTEKRNEAVIITSEPLTDNPSDWVPVPKNHIIVIKPDLSVLIYPINFSEVEYIPKQLGKLEIIRPKTVANFKASCASEDIAPSSFEYHSSLAASSAEQADLKIKHELTLHEDIILSLSIYGNQLFSGSADCTIRVWDLNSFKLIKTLIGHSGSIFSLAHSDHYLFSGSSDNSIKVWDILRLECIATLESNVSAVFSLQVVDKQLFSGHQDTTIKAVDLGPFGSRSARYLKLHNGYVYCLAFVNNKLCSGSGDGIVKIWNTKTLECVGNLVGHKSSVLALCGYKNILFSGSRDFSIKAWDMESENCIRTLTGHKGDVLSLCIQKRNLYSSSADKTIKIWDLDKLMCQQTIIDTAIPYTLVLLQDGFISGSGKNIKIWEDNSSNSNQIRSSVELGIMGITNPDNIMEVLRTFISYKTISSRPEFASACWKGAKYLFSLMEAFGIETQLIEVESSSKNPIVLGRLGSDPKNPTITIYGHYDVVEVSEGWNTDPFVLTGKNGYLYGRGITDDKGPIIATLYAIKELQETVDLGVNFVFVYEGEEEIGSPGFSDAISARKSFFEGTEVILIMNTYWIGDTPSLICGLRGVIDLEITISGAQKDLHTGIDGGAVHEPFHELNYLLSQLVDGHGNILIPNFYDKVRPSSKAERELYSRIDFDLPHWKEALGIKSLKAENIQDFFIRRWCQPNLSIIEINQSGFGSVISKSVTGKINIRLVPDQDTMSISQIVSSYVKEKFDKLNSSNELSIKIGRTGEPWLGDFNNKYYTAAADAIEQVWNKKPIFIKEGGTIPVTNYLEKLLNAPALHLPIGQQGDRAHLPNERLRIDNFTKGKEVLKAFFSTMNKK